MEKIIRPNFVRTVEDLEVFKLAFNVSIEIHKVTLGFPKFEQYALANQLRNSSKSICANIAEGFAKQGQSALEFKRFLSLAIGSAGETSLWLKYSYELSYIDKEKYFLWKNEYEKIIKMLQKFRQSKSNNNDQ